MKKFFVDKKLIKTARLLILSASLFLFAGCDNASTNKSNELTKKEFSMGVSPGPYNDLFEQAVIPILESEGYTVKLVNFSDLFESDLALAEGSIDATVAQHQAFVDVFNRERKANLQPVVHVPSVPAIIYSVKHDSLKDISKDAKIAIPIDTSNAARAFNLIEKAGWIKLKPNIDPILVSAKDIESNPFNLKFIEIESLNMPRILNDIDFAVIPGSAVYMAKLDHTKALLTETIIPPLEIMVVVNGGNENSQWAQDIKRIYQSEQFKSYMQEHNKDGYWVMPES